MYICKNEYDVDKPKELQAITNDFVAGDVSLYFKHLPDKSIQEIIKALDYLLNSSSISDEQKLLLLERSWSIVYKSKPPTMEEFLTPYYLGRQAEDGNIYPRVKKWCLDFMEPSTSYRNLILAPYIGAGKSTTSVLITLYISTLLAYMRDSKKYFNQAPSAVMCQALISYSLKKSSELLLEPFINVLEISDFFEKVHTREGMIKRDREFRESGESINKLFWSTAVPTSALQFCNGSNIKLISNVQNLLGLTLISAVLSELSFFRDAGKSDEFILRVYNDTKGRIESRLKGDWFGRTILDSSPNDLDNPIDQYIWREAHKHKNNMIITGARWEWEPEEYENVEKFPVYLGGPGKPPAILSSAKDTDPTDIMWVPENLKSLFEADLVKAIKDVGGRPSGNMMKLLYDTTVIENIFEPRLRNIYLHLHVPSKANPSHAIWDQVYKDLFKQVGDSLRFYYRPEIPRVFAIDQSEVTDSTAIVISHAEILNNGEILYVVDFSIVVAPLKNDINFDAIRYFIKDLQQLGGMIFLGGAFDRYESGSARQYIERELQIPIHRISVDSTMDPYKNMISDIKAGRLKAGKNIYFKNNLKSLILAQRKSGSYKIEHTIGDMPDPLGNAEWSTSLIGLHAKDVSDAACSTLELLRRIGPGRYFHNEFEELDVAKETLNHKESFIKKVVADSNLSKTKGSQDLALLDN